MRSDNYVVLSKEDNLYQYANVKLPYKKLLSYKHLYFLTYSFPEQDMQKQW